MTTKELASKLDALGEEVKVEHPNAAIVLFILSGALLAGHDDALKERVADFAREALK